MKANSELDKQIDDIIFRCFAQGQYWGTEQDGKLNPDYKPDNPIDRTEAVKLLQALISKQIKEARIDELEGFLERTVHKDKKSGDIDKDGNVMQRKVRTGYNYAKAEMRHDLKDRLAQLEGELWQSLSQLKTLGGQDLGLLKTLRGTLATMKLWNNTTK